MIPHALAAAAAVEAADEPVLELIPPPPSATHPAAQSISGAVHALPVALPTALPANLTPVSAALPKEGVSPPGFLTAIAGNRSVLLSWYPSEGLKPVSGYLIYRGESPQALDHQPINRQPVTDSNYSDNDTASLVGPQNRITYYYRVRAFDIDGRLSGYSDLVSARPNGPLLPPARVEAQAADGSVRLSWAPPLSTGEADLARLWILRGNGPDDLKPLSSVAGTDGSFLDQGLANGTPLYYALRSEDTAGNQSASSPQVRAVPFRPLGAPQDLSALGVGDSVVRLKWNAPEGGGSFALKGYNVYRSTGSGVDLSRPPINKALIPAGTTRWEDDSDSSMDAPKLGLVYNYALVAVDGEDQPSAPSEFSSAGPVPSVTSLSPGEIPVFGESNTLQIQGRKTINISNTWVVNGSNSPYASGTGGNQFALDQQLQVRLTGKVGRKIKVDVDYDDNAQINQQQKISVVYTGDQQEVFKEFAFGDIQMDLGAGRTEFTPYSKSLFGAKLKLESPDGKLRLTAVGAQTKGYTETKHFVGGYEQYAINGVPGRNIPDTNFTPYKYYYLSRDTDLLSGVGPHVVPNSVIIYYDLPGVTANNPTRKQVLSAQNDTLNLVRMTPGVDYLVDNSTGLVTFLDGSPNHPQASTNLVVAYALSNGGTTTWVGYNSTHDDIDTTQSTLSSSLADGKTSNGAHMIQYGSRYGGSEYDGHMSLQFYSLGDRDILDPKNDPDFKFTIYGPNQSLIYQFDRAANYTDVVDFDTRGGWIRFRAPYPFAKGTSGPEDLKDPNFIKGGSALFNGGQADAYNVSARTSNFSIHIEYKHKLSSYNLRASIIRASEVIVLDGRRLTRDQDYFLDYDTGILVFSNPDLVKSNSTVDATYEYLPFVGSYTSTVWGARAEYDLTKDLSIGSSFLWNSADTPQDTPDVKAAPFSLQLLDGDIQATLPQGLLDQLTRLVPGLPKHSEVLKVKAKGEMSHTWFNPNTYSRNNENGVAMVDPFESVDAVVGVSLDHLNWFPSSRPKRSNSDQGPAYTDRRFNHLDSDALSDAHDADTRTGDKRKTQLKLNYANMDTPDRWDSYVYSFGPTANQSIPTMNQLELWYASDHEVTLHVDVGEIDEDAVANGLLATESTTGILSAQADVGIFTPQSALPAGGGAYPTGYNYPLSPRWGGPGGYYADGANEQYWGYGNKILDTEDFDGNQALNHNNNYYSFTVHLSPTASTANAGLTQKLWDLTKPDAIITDGVTQLSTVQGSSDFYTRVKRVRIWIEGCDAKHGGVRIETLQFIGNKWATRSDPNLLNFAGVSVTADTTKLKVTGVNSTQGTPLGMAYQPNLNFYNATNSNGSSNSQLSEQALQMTYRLTSLDDSAGKPYYQARRLLGNGTSVDLGGYRNLRLDVYKPMTLNPGERLLLRLATDDQNYYEYSIALDNVPNGSWSTVTLALDGSDGHRSQYGFPYLRTLNYVALAVQSVFPSLQSSFPGQVDYQNAEVLWLDNLRVTDAIMREGGAAKANFTYDLLDGALTVSHDIRSVDSDFVMMDQQGTPPARHKVSQVLDAKLNAIPKLPVTLRYEDNRQFVDPEHASDPWYSRNFLDPDQSDQKTSGSINVNQVPFVPGLTLDANGYMQHVRQIFLPDAIRQIQTLQGESITPNVNQDTSHLSGEAIYRAPSAYWLIGNDELRMEMDTDTSSILLDQPSVNPANLSFRDQARRTNTYKGRYSGSYHWGKWLTLSPSYAYTLVESAGTLPVPTSYQTQPYYTLDAFGRSDNEPMSRAINPSLVLQFGDLGPLRAPKLGYNFTNTRDYVRNELRSPGSLDLSTSLAPAGMGAFFKAWPSLDLTQSWQVDSVVNNDLRIRGSDRTQSLTKWMDANGGNGQGGFGDRYDYKNNLALVPNIALAEQAPLSTWWVRMDGTHVLGEDVSNPLNIENLAVSSSRRSVTNASTRFDLALFKGWPASWSPHVNRTDVRTMSAPEQVTHNDQWGAGLGVDLREPHIPFWQTLRPSNLNLAYDFSNADNYVVQVVQEDKTSNRISHNLRLTLPTRPNDQTTLTLTLNWTASTDTNFTPGTVVGSATAAGSNDSSLWEPDLRLVYFLNVDRAFKTPDLGFWPFYGRILKVKQVFRLDNDLDMQFKTGAQTVTNASLPRSGSNTYSLRNQISYNVLDNVKVNFALEQRLFNNLYANDAINQAGNQYTIKLSLGVEATF